MATTSIWKVENRLDKVIRYTTNVEKTKRELNEDKELYKALHNVIEYAKADFKTEEQLFVTGINCNAETAYQEMIITKKHFGKENGILAYHSFQSFAEGEVTPEQAHEIGIKLAEELWGDKFEVIVSTHLNTNHIHNHFVLNSVSFVDGKKYRDNRMSYAVMRRTSDDICAEYKLSVIEEKPCGKLNIDFSRYYNSYVQKATYYTIVKDDIDFAIKQAYSYKNFESILKKMGYTITIRAGKLSLCKPPYKRNIRIERSFGEEYTIKNIEERIMNTEARQIPFPEYHSNFKRYRSKNAKRIIRMDRGSFYRLYLYYSYLLKTYPKNKNRVKLSDTMKQEIKKLDEMSDDIKFLAEKKIETSKELLLYKKEAINELNNLFKIRNTLRRKRSKSQNQEDRQALCDEILILSEKINYLKREVKICDRIAERTHNMKKNLDNMDKTEQEKDLLKERKESVRNECRR